MAKTPTTKAKAQTAARVHGGDRSGVLERVVDVVRSLPPAHCAIVLALIVVGWLTKEGMPITSSVSLFVVACIAILLLELIQLKRIERQMELRIDDHFADRTKSLPPS